MPKVYRGDLWPRNFDDRWDTLDKLREFKRSFKGFESERERFVRNFI